MEKIPRPQADNQPNPHHWRPKLSPESDFANCKKPTPEPRPNDWEEILTKHEDLRQLIKRSKVTIGEWGQYRQPNMVLANYRRGPVSQAYGWIKTAIEEDPRPEFDHREFPGNYRGDPVEQSLLWLMLNFDPDNAASEIVDTVELLSDGQIADALKVIENYMIG